MIMQTLHCCSLTEGYFGPPVMLPKVLAINNKIRTRAPKLAEAGKHKVNLCNPPFLLAFTSTDAAFIIKLNPPEAERLQCYTHHPGGNSQINAFCLETDWLTF